MRWNLFRLWNCNCCFIKSYEEEIWDFGSVVWCIVLCCEFCFWLLVMWIFYLEFCFFFFWIVEVLNVINFYVFEVSLGLSFLLWVVLVCEINLISCDFRINFFNIYNLYFGNYFVCFEGCDIFLINGFDWSCEGWGDNIIESVLEVSDC